MAPASAIITPEQPRARMQALIEAYEAIETEAETPTGWHSLPLELRHQILTDILDHVFPQTHGRMGARSLATPGMKKALSMRVGHLMELFGSDCRYPLQCKLLMFEKRKAVIEEKCAKVHAQQKSAQKKRSRRKVARYMLSSESSWLLIYTGVAERALSTLKTRNLACCAEDPTLHA